MINFGFQPGRFQMRVVGCMNELSLGRTVRITTIVFSTHMIGNKVLWRSVESPAVDESVRSAFLRSPGLTCPLSRRSMLPLLGNHVAFTPHTCILVAQRSIHGESCARLHRIALPRSFSPRKVKDTFRAAHPARKDAAEKGFSLR